MELTGVAGFGYGVGGFGYGVAGSGYTRQFLVFCEEIAKL